MKHLLLLLPLLAACSPDPSLSLKRDTNTLTHKAYHYYGLSETKDRQLIKEITGVDPVRTEWCAAFVNMVLLEQGYPQSSTVSAYPLMARSFLQWGNKVTKPEQGDVMIFERGNQGWQGHVAFYVSEKTLNGKLYYAVLGGNQNDKVSIDLYPADKLLGIRRLRPDDQIRLASLY